MHAMPRLASSEEDRSLHKLFPMGTEFFSAELFALRNMTTIHQKIASKMNNAIYWTQTMAFFL